MEVDVTHNSWVSDRNYHPYCTRTHLPWARLSASTLAGGVNSKDGPIIRAHPDQSEAFNKSCSSSRTGSPSVSKNTKLLLPSQQMGALISIDFCRASMPSNSAVGPYLKPLDGLEPSEVCCCISIYEDSGLASVILRYFG